MTPENKVEYIGKEHSGSMDNNRHEGHPGVDIGPIGEMGKADYAERPNIVLLMAGTNNINFNVDPDNAPDMLGRVIDDVVHACPDAVVLVATLIPLLDARNEELRIRFNDALPAVIATRADENKHVARVDMGRITSHHINTIDRVHPTDEGYRLMALVWYEAITAAGKKGWIKEPFSVSGEGEPENANAELGPEDAEPKPENTGSEPEPEPEPKNAEQDQEKNKPNQGNVGPNQENSGSNQVESSFGWTIVNAVMAILVCAVLVITVFAIRRLTYGSDRNWRYSPL